MSDDTEYTSYVFANGIARQSLHRQEGWELKKTAAPISRFLWWCLERLGAITPCLQTYYAYTFRPPAKSDTILGAVNNALRDRVRSYGDTKKYAVLMGYEDYLTYINETRDLMPIGDQTLRFNVGPFSYRGAVFNMPVHVVESIKGVALVPKVAVEEKRAAP